MSGPSARHDPPLHPIAIGQNRPRHFRRRIPALNAPRPAAHVAPQAVGPHIEEVARVSGRPVIVGGAGEADAQWVLDCHRKGLRVYGMGSTVTIAIQPMITNIAEAPNLFDFSLAWCQATVGSVQSEVGGLTSQVTGLVTNLSGLLQPGCLAAFLSTLLNSTPPGC